MESRAEIAVKKREKGYNCCQAVVCAYCDLLGVDEDTVFKAAEGFGSGMGDMQHTCGAISGAVMAAGLKNSQGASVTTTKGSTYQITKEITKRFGERAGSTVCRELKGVGTGKVLRSCPDCVRDAARITEELLFD